MKTCASAIAKWTDYNITDCYVKDEKSFKPIAVAFVDTTFSTLLTDRNGCAV
jgi:hypothetical protein